MLLESEWWVQGIEAMDACASVGGGNENDPLLCFGCKNHRFTLKHPSALACFSLFKATASTPIKTGIQHTQTKNEGCFKSFKKAAKPGLTNARMFRALFCSTNSLLCRCPTT